METDFLYITGSGTDRETTIYAMQKANIYICTHLHVVHPKQNYQGAITKIECFVLFFYSNSDNYLRAVPEEHFPSCTRLFLLIPVMRKTRNPKTSSSQFMSHCLYVKILNFVKLKLNFLSSESSQVCFSFV